MPPPPPHFARLRHGKGRRGRAVSASQRELSVTGCGFCLGLHMGVGFDPGYVQRRPKDSREWPMLAHACSPNPDRRTARVLRVSHTWCLRDKLESGQRFNRKERRKRLVHGHRRGRRDFLYGGPAVLVCAGGRCCTARVRVTDADTGGYVGSCSRAFGRRYRLHSNASLSSDPEPAHRSSPYRGRYPPRGHLALPRLWRGERRC